MRKQKNIESSMNSELCFAVHAEWNVLMNALRTGKDIQNATMYIGHLKGGEIQKFSGKPYCTVCSRLIAASGLKGVILFNGNDYAFLNANEFNEQSYKTTLEKHGLQMDEKQVKAARTT